MSKVVPKPTVIERRPKGRPKGSTNGNLEIERRIEIACKRLSVRAFEVIEKIMLDETVEPKFRLTAAKEILDRGLGKAKQRVDQNVKIEGGEALIELIRVGRERSNQQSLGYEEPLDVQVLEHKPEEVH